MTEAMIAYASLLTVAIAIMAALYVVVRDAPPPWLIETARRASYPQSANLRFRFSAL